MELYLEYWTIWPTFVISNFILSVLIWTFYGRFVLDLIIPNHDNYIKSFFHNLTNPFIKIFSFITPGFLHPLFILLYVPFLLIVLRVLNYLMHQHLGMQIIPDDMPLPSS